MSLLDLCLSSLTVLILQPTNTMQLCYINSNSILHVCKQFIPL